MLMYLLGCNTLSNLSDHGRLYTASSFLGRVPCGAVGDRPVYCAGATPAKIPRSNLQTTFGHTRFIWIDVRPVVEGIGTFPDIWLDEADPIGFLVGLP